MGKEKVLALRARRKHSSLRAFQGGRPRKSLAMGKPRFETADAVMQACGRAVAKKGLPCTVTPEDLEVVS